MKDTDSMAPRKLSDSDKGDIIELYKQPKHTTSTLAEQYGVSNSTISRILKTTLPPEEYSALISQKRMAGSDKTEAPAKQLKRSRSVPSEVPETAAEEVPEESPRKSPRKSPEEDLEERSEVSKPKLKTAAEKDEARSPKTSRRRLRTRAEAEDEQLPLLGTEPASTDEQAAATNEKNGSKPVLASSVAEEEDSDDDDEDDLLGLDETLGDDFGDDDDEDDEEDDLDDDDLDLGKPKLQSTEMMEIMPLREAVLPKPCYLVVDMRSELITRPLSDFADLGQIPGNEEKAKTLPVFDNHRVARRFSRNKQRVIKVPDGSLITRTSPYLEAKGITRLLVDGQVFDLVGTR